MTKPILNLDEVQIEDRPAYFQPRGAAATRFASRTGPISTRIGAQKLGYNITVVPPGKRAFPLHNHHNNEEMFFILQGHGELRIGKETYPVRQGDFIANPTGGPEIAHQIVNTGSEEMRYLAVSTMLYPDTVEYPDSGKIATYSRQTAPNNRAAPKGATRPLANVRRSSRVS
jgi:uncharacterized cupin superfamily protein